MQSKLIRSGYITSHSGSTICANGSRSSRPRANRFSFRRSSPTPSPTANLLARRCLPASSRTPTELLSSSINVCLKARATSWLRLFGCGVRGGSGLALLCFALNRAVDADDGVAALVEKPVEPQHVLARRAILPHPHCVLGLEQGRQPVFT